MSSTKSKAMERAAVEEEPPPWAPWFTQAAFVLTLILMIARALMSESPREGVDVLPETEAAPLGAGAASTVILNALCCLPALLVLLRRAADRTYIIRWNWSQVAFGLLAVWAAFSVRWSTDRFITVIAASSTIAAAALIWSTAQLVRSWLRLRIVAGVCLGLLLGYSAHGVIYRYVQHPDDVAIWKKNKEQFLRARGLEPDSFQAQQFERKVLAGEMIGFNQSPNSFAAVIVLLLAASAGIAMQRVASGDGFAWPIGIAVACAPALLVLLHTSSRTAFGTIAIAGSTLALLAQSALREWLGRHARAAYIACLVAFALGVAAIVGHGVAHGSLPHDSLNFRWRYWVAAGQLVKLHPITGVGWGNFGPHYLSVRLPAAAEEVRDPHNFIVRGFAELGIVGGVLVLAWLARAAWELTRPILPASTSTASTSPLSGLITIVAIIVGGVLLNMLCAIDWSQPGAYLQLEVFARLLWAGLLFVGLIVTILRSRQEQILDSRPAPWVLYGLLVGLGVFFVHNLMDFVIMEAGALTVFAVVLGAALGVRTPSAAGQKKRRGAAIAVLGVASVAWLAGVVMVVIPIADAEQRAASGDDAMRRGKVTEAAELYHSAAAIVPWNSDYPYRAAHAWMYVAGAPPEKIQPLLAQAIAADPSNVKYYSTRAAYEARSPKPDEKAIRADFDQLLRLDPRNMSARIEYAEFLQKQTDAHAAAEQYRRALEINAGYDKTEPKRLSSEQATQIEEKLRTLSS